MSWKQALVEECQRENQGYSAEGPAWAQVLVVEVVADMVEGAAAAKAADGHVDSAAI
jgi:hypothetical protein